MISTRLARPEGKAEERNEKRHHTGPTLQPASSRAYYYY